MSADRKLEGRVALVTGAGRGIGRAIALKLAGEGARLVVNDLSTAPCAQVVQDILASGGQAAACEGSVTAVGFADRFIATAMDRWGGLDIIVNNAGYTWDAVLQKMSDEQWAAILDCHLTAPFRILRAAQPVIKALHSAERAQGREVFRKVVNISSVSGLGGNAGQANYAAAKAGITGLTKTLAKEWGRMLVNVNTVAFGYIQTRLTEASTDEPATVDIEGREIKVGINAGLLKAIEDGVPLGRGGTPEEAAGAVYLMCTPESNYISGQTLVCGGGFTLG